MKYWLGAPVGTDGQGISGGNGGAMDGLPDLGDIPEGFDRSSRAAAPALGDYSH
ncbi:MAG TPA: hypothetical protein VNZ26_03020 [Vicinamibacterales bacterium]|nr:hypothetical protein [Vicinamibacterales bacterium]